MSRYLVVIVALVLVSVMSAADTTDKIGKKYDYPVADNEIDDTAPITHKQHRKAAEQKPIAVLVRTVKGWIQAIPEAIVTLFVNLLSPFIDKQLIRDKVEHFIHSLLSLIAQELPKPYRNIFTQFTQFLDMFEMIG